jgi:general secretion pathway protein L
MARAVGIEISATHVRAVTVVSSYRHNGIEKTAEVEINQNVDVREALASAVRPMLGHGESVAVGISGLGAYLLRVELPATALRQIEQVVPFELEARIPVDIDELVHDFVVSRDKGTSDTINVMIAAAPLRGVRKVVEDCREILGKDVERVACGPLPLVNLVPYLPRAFSDDPAIMILDLGEASSDILIIRNGRPAFARTISHGIERLPESADALVAAIRQSLLAWVSQTDHAVSQVYLTGIGATMAGAESYLSQRLEVAVLPLPKLDVDYSSGDSWESMSRYTKALGIAVGLGVRPNDPDLRSGSLSYQRGYAFLKEKAPLLSGLVTAVFISILFANWAALRSLDREQRVLSEQLEIASQQILGKATTEPSEALELLAKRKALEESDPMPHMDAFDVLVAISNAIPNTIVHDIDELDMQREHVKMTGIVGLAAEAQQIASNLKEQRCFQDVRLSKVVQMVNSDRQKYGLEWDVRCPEDESTKTKKKKPEEPAGGAQ